MIQGQSVQVFRARPRSDRAYHRQLRRRPSRPPGDAGALERGGRGPRTPPAAVLTFDPHPRRFFAREKAPPRLSTVRDKLERFASHGVARGHVARFDQSLADLLRRRIHRSGVGGHALGRGWVLVGDDFRFGHGHVGAPDAPAREGQSDFQRRGHADGKRSRASVRRARPCGRRSRSETSNARGGYSGRPYATPATSRMATSWAADLGFPTASVVLRSKPALCQGIFAVRVQGLGGQARGGVASLGVRPTVKQGAKPLLEIFVFDFDEAIYGRRIAVEFLHKLRDEERYADLDQLTRQIRVDVAQARDYFATIK